MWPSALIWMATLHQTLWQQPGVGGWRKSTRAGQTKLYYTSTFLCFSGTVNNTEDVFAFRRPSWASRTQAYLKAFLLLHSTEYPGTIFWQLPGWESVPTQKAGTYSVPAQKVDVLVTWSPFLCYPGVYSLLPCPLIILFFPASRVIRWGLCRSHSTPLSTFATFHCPL